MNFSIPTSQPLSIILAAFAVFAAGCVAQEVRETSDQAAVHIEHLNSEIGRYQQVLQGDAAGRIDRIANERTSLAPIQFQLDQRLALWEVTRSSNQNASQAKRIFDSVLSLTEANVAAERDRVDRFAREMKQLSAMQKKFADQSKLLSGLARRAHQLGKVPDIAAQAQFYVEFAKETNEKLEELEKPGDDETPN